MTKIEKDISKISPRTIKDIQNYLVYGFRCEVAVTISATNLMLIMVEEGYSLLMNGLGKMALNLFIDGL